MSRPLGPFGGNPFSAVPPSRTPGPLGWNDAADPNVVAEFGDTPGPFGVNGYALVLADNGPGLPLGSLDRYVRIEQAKNEIARLLCEGEIDLLKGFRALKLSYDSVGFDGRYRNPYGGFSRTRSLKDAAKYADESNTVRLLYYMGEGKVNEHKGAPLAMKGGAEFDPHKVPGIVVSRTVLRELGGGAVGQGLSQLNKSISRAYKDVLAPGCLGLVHFPDHPAVACVFSDAGNLRAAGEVSVAAARQAGVLKGKHDFQFYTDYDAATVEYFILTGTSEFGKDLDPADSEQHIAETIRQRTAAVLRRKLNARYQELNQQQ